MRRERSHSRAPAALLAVSALAVAAPARAAGESTAVLVTATNAEDDATAVAIERVTAALLASADVQVVALEELLGSARTPHKELRLARRQVQKGRRAFERASVDRARRHFRSALQIFRRHPAYLEDFGLVVETLHQLGACARLVGRRSEWIEAITAAVLFDPTRKPDPTYFNPELRAEFDELAAAVRGRPSGKVTIDTAPADARVYVDGRVVGRGPVTIELTHGDHFVRVVEAGHRSWGKVFRVEAGEATLSAQLGPLEQWQTVQALLDGDTPAGTGAARERILRIVLGTRSSSCTVDARVRLMTTGGVLLAHGEGELPLHDENGQLTAALEKLVAGIPSTPGPAAAELEVTPARARPCADELAAAAAAAAAAAEAEMLAQPDPEAHALDWALVGGGATAALLGSSILLSQELLLQRADADRDAKDRAVRVGRTGFGVATAGLVSVGVGVALLLWL